jgi:hypothetical protein
MAKVKKTRARRKRPAAPAAVEAVAIIQSWPTDPMGGLPPVQVAAPTLPGMRLPIRIVDPAEAPAPQVYSVGTGDFRYWTAAEALRRAAELWSAAGTSAWNPEIGGGLPVQLDEGVDLNAYYSRQEYAPQNIKQGLSFFHDTVRDASSGQPATVWSGESPDVVAHELGHAVLDSLKPALWGLATTESAAFHESFGDMSAILTALQLPVVRQSVLEETDGRLWRNSSVSRLAEQLGYAIRQRSPAAVDSDSLRNASNSFTYTDPTTLPANGPASGLSREPHNFSRIFTGAFLEALGGMVLILADPPKADDVLQASQDLSRLLARAAVNAPVRTQFFKAVAEQLVLADGELFNGKYAEPLTSALVRRGLLPLRSLAAAPPTVTRTEAAARPVRLALDGASLGLQVTTVFVEAPAVDDGGAARPLGVSREAGPPSRQTAAQAFVEELILRGRVAVGPRLGGAAIPMTAVTRKRPTHQLSRVDGEVELQRLAFDCGC